MIDSQFEHAIANRFAVPGIAQRKSTHPRQNTGPHLPISEPAQPTGEDHSLTCFDHLDCIL